MIQHELHQITSLALDESSVVQPANLKVQIFDSLCKNLQKLADQDGVSLNQFIALQSLRRYQHWLLRTIFKNELVEAIAPYSPCMRRRSTDTEIVLNARGETLPR